MDFLKIHVRIISQAIVDVKRPALERSGKVIMGSIVQVALELRRWYAQGDTSHGLPSLCPTLDNYLR